MAMTVGEYQFLKRSALELNRMVSDVVLFNHMLFNTLLLVAGIFDIFFCYFLV